MSNFYAGIGARRTPLFWLEWFTALAERLNELHYVLRSGGAGGADTAFEMGADPEDAEIYLPWHGFNNNESPLSHISAEAMEMAEHYHPRWSQLGSAAKKFMARNCYQVLGLDLDTPVDFIVCWTPAGVITGGTGQALRMAEDLNIPVFNFGCSDPTTVKNELDDLIKGRTYHD